MTPFGEALKNIGMRCASREGKFAHHCDVDWESGQDIIQEKMTEYALAVLKNRKGRIVFFNFCSK